jgi:hypothetical protein
MFAKIVYPDFFSLRIDDPQLVDAGTRVDHTFLIEIEMCGSSARESQQRDPALPRLPFSVRKRRRPSEKKLGSG